MGEIKGVSFRDKKGRAIEFRTAFPEDSSLLIRYLENYQDGFEFMISTGDEVNRDLKYEKSYIQAHLSRENSLMILGFCANELIAILNFSGGNKKRVFHDGEIGLSVAPEFQGCGIGKKIMQIFIHWAQNRPFLKRVSLSVMGNHRKAIQLYQELGFEEEGRKKLAVVFEDGRIEDLLMMGLLLKRPHYG